jgi:DNA polymerase IV
MSITAVSAAKPNAKEAKEVTRVTEVTEAKDVGSKVQAMRLRNDTSLCQSRALIMHIDLNSCFSTIEQQANPLIRNKPVAVGAYTKGNGMILAASYDAKALGIKLGTSVREARQICPGIIVLMPDPPKYRVAHQRFRDILLQYTSDVVPKSIDEFVMDFHGSAAVRAGRSMEEIGFEIKQKIKEHLGEYVTVNIGIGSNRFLAKLAAGLHKPDGLDALTPDNLLETYKKLDLLDLPGINRRFKARLYAAGITNPYEMFQAPGTYLKSQVFFSKLGHHWYLRLRGWEVDDREFERKTIGHQYALQHKTGERDELRRLLMKLCEKTGRRLRSNELVANGIHLYLRFANGQSWHHGHKTAHPLYATQDIYREANRLLATIPRFPDNVSHISVNVFNLAPCNPEQLGLFDSVGAAGTMGAAGGGSPAQKALARAADLVNDRYGEFTVIPAIMASMDKTILDRIAFGNIRDME